MTLNWWGKLLGGTLGFMMGGPPGALLGAAIGHNFDKNADRLWGFDSEPGAQERNAFFAATFLVMGHLAKMDGRVSENEIAAAQAVMARLRLTPIQKKSAIYLFMKGKHTDFSLAETLAEFRRQCRQHDSLIARFMEIQLHAAYADGVPPAGKHALLIHICDQLGGSRWQFDALDAFLRNRYERHHTDQDNHERRSGAGRKAKASTLLTGAYATLGLDSSASDAEVKLAYRRLINRCHPDKLVANRLSKEALARTNEKTHQVKAAYEYIKQARGIAK
jgi:DnaJ like chaperone protein